MDFNALIDSITPETYQALLKALELGKWADGNRLTPEQKEHVMQAIIAYGEKHLPPQQRVGFIDRGSKDEGEVCDDPHPVEQPVKFLQ
ncbi:YeaC family protein [Ketobacter sp.]|uniref:YeaC family protein n=1 Tax=Ketobacter sp. TaxID=2083498 RepID=UPI000F221260|nr:DUF1315 family protein [Ketobacter sp.]MEE2731572.1 DUF1315 family protein [Pseudomonadota bacterium]RLT93520.1 MAG: DUF1315 family protein [Ketobacter sp.]